MAGDATHQREAAAVEPVAVEKPQYNRVLIKVSGEALMGFQEFGVDPAVMERIACEIKAVHQLGVEIAIVVGGGNIIRGVKVSEAGFDRATGDYMGMLATVINALALQSALEETGIYTRVMSAIDWLKLPSLLFAAGPSVTLRRSGWSFWRPEPAIRTLQRIRLLLCALWKSRRISS